MRWESEHQVQGAKPSLLGDLFAPRPPRWLRPFLQLAVAGVKSSNGVGEGDRELWYRLRAATTPASPGQPVIIPFIWHPAAGDAVFQSFNGEFVLGTDEARVTLGIRGELTGGTPSINMAVMDTLLTSLVTAVGQSR